MGGKQSEYKGCVLVTSERNDITDTESNFLTLYANQIELAIVVARLFEEVQKQAITDPLTNLYNRRYFEDNIVRKGAISAKKGEKVIIPINMRDGCIIGIGKGNDDWNNSAPHGAGRVMSRSEAMKMINLDDYKKSMENIYTTSVTENTKDEAPFAYKSIKEILEHIIPTVEVVTIIKPVYNFKASESSEI